MNRWAGRVYGEAAAVGNFRSAMEWPTFEAEEEPNGTPVMLGHCFEAIAKTMLESERLAPQCESPIEVMLGAALRVAVRYKYGNAVKVIPQYKLGRYRFDFAVKAGEKLISLIECDGAQFHSTPAQRANDRAKDGAAAIVGAMMFRFSGSQIHRNTHKCVAAVLSDLGARLP